MSLTGLYTAIITPFGKDGELDREAFVGLIDKQIDAGVDGIVVCGSTGEGATVTADEKVRLWSWAVERASGRIAVIAGSGNNDTRNSIDLSRKAQACGVQGLLLVTPYYNKPTPAGQMAHMRAIADSVEVPVVMYNVPSRTGTNMSADTQLAIAAACPNVVATKEASANLEQIGIIIANAPAHFHVLAGDDVLALPTIALGGRGCIAVVSNYAPRMFARLVHSAMAGDYDTARTMQRALTPFFTANFVESNPGPVKYMMSVLGLADATFRLPMLPPAEAAQAYLRNVCEGFVDA